MQPSKPFSLLIPVLLLGAVLSACQTLSPEERRALDGRTCLSYGFRAGSDAYATCLLNLELDRRAEWRSIRERQDARFDMWGPPVILERRIIIDKRS